MHSPELRHVIKESWPILLIAGALISLHLIGQALYPWDEHKEYVGQMELVYGDCCSYTVEPPGMTGYAMAIIDYLHKLLDPSYEGAKCYPLDGTGTDNN